MSGFGAESDAPGQGLWTLCEHYRFTKDIEWLKNTWPISLKIDSRGDALEVSIELPVDAPLFEIRLPGWNINKKHKSSGIEQTGLNSWAGYSMLKPLNQKVTLNLKHE